MLVVVRLYVIDGMRHSALPTGGGAVMLPKNMRIRPPLGERVSCGSHDDRGMSVASIVYGPATVIVHAS